MRGPYRTPIQYLFLLIDVLRLQGEGKIAAADEEGWMLGVQQFLVDGPPFSSMRRLRLFVVALAVKIRSSIADSVESFQTVRASVCTFAAPERTEVSYLPLLFVPAPENEAKKKTYASESMPMVRSSTSSCPLSARLYIASVSS